MKKIFFLAATMIAAISANAWNGFDYTSTSMYTMPVDQIFTNLVNCSLQQTEAPKEGKVTGKNSINLTTGGTEASFNMGDVVWTYVNSTDGTTIAKQYENYVQPNGKDRTVTIPAAMGDKVLINVVEAVAETGITMSGIAETFAGLAAGDNVFTATGTITIMTTAGKPKFSAIKPYTGTGWNDAKVAPAASRIMKDGKVYIQKANGKLINMLGF